MPWEVDSNVASVLYVPVPFGPKSTARKRQLLLTECLLWQDRTKDPVVEHVDRQGKRCSYDVVPNETSKRKRLENDEATNNTCGGLSQSVAPVVVTHDAAKSDLVAKVPLDIIGVVVDFYCADVNDAAELATISTSWREAVVASLMWTQRVEPITQRNPFPLVEREHLAWHWDCSDAVHLALLVEYIMNSFKHSSAALPSDHHENSLVLWIQGMAEFRSGNTKSYLDFIQAELHRLLRQRLLSADGDYLEVDEGTACVIQLRCIQHNCDARTTVHQSELWLNGDSSARIGTPQDAIAGKAVREERSHYSMVDAFPQNVSYPSCETLRCMPIEQEIAKLLHSPTMMPKLRQLEVGKWHMHWSSGAAEKPLALFTRIFVSREGQIAPLAAKLTHLDIVTHTIDVKEFSWSMQVLKSLEYLSTNIPIPVAAAALGSTPTTTPPNTDIKLPQSLHTLELSSWNLGCNGYSNPPPAAERREISAAVFAAIPGLLSLRRLVLRFRSEDLTSMEVSHVSQCNTLESLLIKDLTEGGSLDHYKLLVQPSSRLVETLRFLEFDVHNPRALRVEVPRAPFLLDSAVVFSRLTSLHVHWCQEVSKAIEQTPHFASKLCELGIQTHSHLFPFKITPRQAQHLSNVSTVKLDCSGADSIVQLKKLPALRHLTVKLTDGNFTRPNDESAMAPLTQWHKFPALETLKFGNVECGLSWHIFTNQNVCNSFRAASAKHLKQVSVKACYNFCACQYVENGDCDQFYTPLSDEGENDLAVSVVSDLVAPGNRTHDLSDDVLALSDPHDEEVEAELDKFRNLHFPFSEEKEWRFFKRMHDRFNFIDGGHVTATPSWSCFLALRRAMVFWRSLWPRIKFVVEDTPAESWMYM